MKDIDRSDVLAIKYINYVENIIIWGINYAWKPLLQT